MERNKRRPDLTRDQEIWGMALWVERVHGDKGWFHIATEQDRLLADADFEGVSLWRAVGRRWQELQDSRAQPN